MAKTMAEVLAEHQLSVAWESGDDRAITCLCGLDLPSEDVRGEIDMQFLAAHQAAALTAAGYGLVADFRESNLKAITEEIANPLRTDPEP